MDMPDERRGVVESDSRGCSVVDADPLVVVEPGTGATAPGGNSSAESVPASSSHEAATPVNGEPFAVAVEFAVGSGLA
jgi:hypothetical protein